MTTSSDSIISGLKEEGWVFISSGEHKGTVLSVKESELILQENAARSGTEQPKQNYYSIATGGLTGPDIYRNAAPITKDENGKDILPKQKSYFFNGQELYTQLAAYYPEYPNRDLKLSFEELFQKGQHSNNPQFIDFIKHFFTFIFMTKGVVLKDATELAEFLIQTLNQNGVYDCLGEPVNRACMKEGLVPTAPTRKHHIFYNAQTGLLEIIQEYDTDIAAVFELAADGSPGSPVMELDQDGILNIKKQTIGLRTLTHIRVKVESGQATPSIEYIASGKENIKLAADVIKMVTPQGQNPRVDGETVDFNIGDIKDLDFSIDQNGRTALHRAVLIGDLNLVLILLEGKLVDINAKDKQGKTALHYAAELDSEDMVLALVDRGADCTIEDNNGKWAYQYATKAEPMPVRKFLKALTLVDGYLKLKTEDPVEGNTKISITQGMRACLVEDVSCNPVSPIAVRNTNIVNELIDEKNNKDIKKNIEDELKKPKHSVIGTSFARFIRDLVEIFIPGFSKKQRKDIIKPQNDESHGAAFCKQLSLTVLPERRQRSQSASAMFRYSLVGTGQLEKAEVRGVQQKPLFGRSKSCSSLFANKASGWRKETDHKQPKTSAASPCLHRVLKPYTPR